MDKLMTPKFLAHDIDSLGPALKTDHIFTHSEPGFWQP